MKKSELGTLAKRHVLLFTMLVAVLVAGTVAADEVVCEGAYTGHLQGTATDGTNVYWSFTTAMVKTDLPGKPGSSSGDAYLSAAVDMIITEASRLGAKVEHR